MSATRNTLIGGIRVASLASPAVAGRLAGAAFFSSSPRMRVREDDRFTHASARRDAIELRGRRITTYQWGAGTRTALLLHGWVGRASQFATLVRDLVAEGYRVIAFDAPAHGASPGRRTDARDWMDAAQLLAGSDGPIDLLVGHSLGGFAALAATRAGLAARRVVTISGAGTVRAFHEEFARMLRLSPAVRTAFEADFHRRLGMTRAQSDARFDTLAHPLPGHVEALFVHDADDRVLPTQHSIDLHDAHPGRSHLLVTHGFGHNSILGADAALDAVLAFAAEGLEAFAAPTAAPRGARTDDRPGPGAPQSR